MDKSGVHHGLGCSIALIEGFCSGIDLATARRNRRQHEDWGLAQRLRDPRLALGVGLIAVSVITATAVVSSADDRVLVWAASHDLASGTVISESI